MESNINKTINFNRVQKLVDNGNAILISGEKNVFWITSIKSTNLSLIIMKNLKIALTDKRYYENVSNSLKDFRVMNWTKESIAFVNGYFSKSEINKIYVDENEVTIKRLSNIKKIFPGKSIKSISFDRFREIKTSFELNKIKMATKITDKIFSKLVPLIKIRDTEKNVKKKLEELVLKENVAGFSFPPIIAFGKNTSNPHWTPSEKQLKVGELIIIDFGVEYMGYVSDFTRTFLLSEIQTKEYVENFKILKKSLNLAIDSIKPGVEIKSICLKVRKYLEMYDLEKNFIHSLGHGIGINIHESPSLSYLSKGKFEEGMVVTIEPGIYFENKYGMRIENDVYVGKKKCIILNKSPISLHIDEK